MIFKESIFATKEHTHHQNQYRQGVLIGVYHIIYIYKYIYYILTKDDDHEDIISKNE